VVEEGTHQGLLASKGAYFRLATAQNLNFKLASASPEGVVDDSLVQSFIPETQPRPESADTPELSEGESARESLTFQRETISRMLSLMMCLKTIFGEQKQLQSLFLIGSTTCVLLEQYISANQYFSARSCQFSSSPERLWTKNPSFGL
jgi:hypothetical protein